MALAQKGDDHKYHGIVFHTEEEHTSAERLCQIITDHGKQTGRPLNVVTFDSFSGFGQILTNLNNAVDQSRFILCSEDFSAESCMSVFFTNAALYDKIPGGFILLRIDKSVAETENPALETLKYIRLTEDWDFHSTKDKEKLVFELSGEIPPRVQSDARNLPDPNTVSKGCSDLPTGVTSDAESVSLSGPESHFAPPQGACPVAEGKGPVNKPGSSKWGEKRITGKKCTMPKDTDCTLDAIVFHSADEAHFAASLIETLRPFEIKTFGGFSSAAKQELININDALKYARLALCSVKFCAEDEHSTFFANTALQKKIPEERFIKLFTENTPNAGASVNSLKGIRLTDDWQLTKTEKEKLVKLLMKEKCNKGTGNIPDELGPAETSSDDKQQQENRSENNGGTGIQDCHGTPQTGDGTTDDSPEEEERDGASQVQQQLDDLVIAPSTPAHLNIDNVSVTSSFFKSDQHLSGMRSYDVSVDDTKTCPEPSSFELFQSGPSSRLTSGSGNPKVIERGVADGNHHGMSSGPGASVAADKSLVQSSDSLEDISSSLSANNLEEDDGSNRSETAVNESTSANRTKTCPQTTCQRKPQSTQASLFNTSPPTAVAEAPSAGEAPHRSRHGQLTLDTESARSPSSVPSTCASNTSKQELGEIIEKWDSDDLSSGYYSNSQPFGRTDDDN